MQARIEDLKQGGICSYVQKEWAYLGEEHDGAFMILKTISEMTPFSDEEVKDYKESKVKTVIEERILPDLEESEIMKRTVDLTAENGAEDYGKLKAKAAPLTLAEYTKYRAYIPTTNEWYWLATAASADEPYIGPPYMHHIRSAGSDNSLHSTAPDEAKLGVRPAVVIPIGTVVDVTTDAEIKHICKLCPYRQNGYCSNSSSPRYEDPVGEENTCGSWTYKGV